MARLTYDVCETTAEPACEVVEQELRSLRDRLSNDLADCFRALKWAPPRATDAVGNGFLDTLDKRIAAVADDFRHGLVGGKRLSKDPLVSVLTSVSNSPGAVVQGGIGNAQTVRTTSQVQDVRTAITQFIQSKEVQALQPEQRESLTDIADVVTAELSKPSPDSSKLARWGKRRLAVAEQVGIAVATGAIQHALFGGGTPS
jgi:hypothetical protein